jgi:hypothetical protein
MMSPPLEGGARSALARSGAPLQDAKSGAIRIFNTDRRARLGRPKSPFQSGRRRFPFANDGG